MTEPVDDARHGVYPVNADCPCQVCRASRQHVDIVDNLRCPDCGVG